MRLLWFVILAFPCGAADQIPDLDHVRQVNLDHAAKLPNFLADEIAVRYHRSKADSDWQITDRIESEIAVRGRDGFTRQHVRLNGQPWDKPFPGWNWGVAFGDELPALFEPKCPTVLEYAGRQDWQGKPAMAYRFHSPRDGCFGYWDNRKNFFSRTRRYNPARQGRFLLDSNENLVRFEMESIGFPKDFGNDTWTEAISWDYVMIGEESFLLPVTFDQAIGSSAGQLWKAHVEYRNHRHFEAATKVNFQP